MIRDVAVIGFDGVRLSSVGLFLDLFDQMRTRVAEQFRARDDAGMQTKVKLLGQNARPIRVAGDRKIDVDNGLEQAPLLLIHVPDFERAATALAAGLPDLRQSIEWLQVQHAGGAYLSATGQGICLLAEAGLVGSRPVPLGRRRAEAFRARYPHIPVDMTSGVLEQGRIMMARGVAQEAGMLTRMIGRCMSTAMAGALADAAGLLVEQEGLSDDPLVAAGQIWLSERATRGLRISALAAHLGISQQTLIRRFRARLGMTPRTYLRVLRMRSAQQQLRDTRRSIAQVATLVGYDDLKSFQQAFRAQIGTTPTNYRSAARAAQAAAAQGRLISLV
jgi:transcriptional regulator GlxA family with amidase domain